MAAANTKSKNNSIQPGRRRCRSCAEQTLGATRRDPRLERTALLPAVACTMPPGSTPPSTALISDRSSAPSSCLGNVLIFLRSVTAYANRPDHLSLVNYGDATLQRRCPRQRQRSYTPVTHLIFKHFARPAEDRRSSRFANANLNARNLRIVEPLQQ